jgi:hypothetical protein
MRLPEDVLRTSIRALATQWPTLVQPLLDALSSIVTQRPLSVEVIASLREALSSNRIPLYETASYLAADASAYDENAVDLVLSMSRAARAHGRHNAILCLTEQTPMNVTLDILGRGIADTSSRVRIKAADWVLRMRLAQALPPLEAALSTERHPEAKRAMEFTLHLVRDGYLVRPYGDEKVSLTLDHDGSIWTEFVAQSLIAEHGIECVVSNLKRTTNAA